MSKPISSCSPFRRTVYQLPYKERHVQPSSAMRSCTLKRKQLRIWTDRINLKDWAPLLKSIADDRSLAEITAYSRRIRGCGKKVKGKRNAEKKVDKFRHCLPRSLVEAISSCAKNSSAITSVTIDGIPLVSRYLITLCDGLKCAENLSHLCLARCRIGDGGCALVLNALTDSNNLCILDLTSCRLTDWSALSLSVFLKKEDKQKEETSLLHSDLIDRDKPHGALGLHTLVLNHNPKLCDRGALVLIDVVKQDFWLKILNLRDCGLTSRSGEAVMKLLKTNSVLAEMDLKENDISVSTLHNVARILRRRLQNIGRSAVSMSKKRLSDERRNHVENSALNGNNKAKKRASATSQKSQCRRRNPGNNHCKIITRQKSYSKVKAVQAKSKDAKPNVAKLSNRLSKVIDSNTALLQELVSDQELLAEVKTRRLDMEREFFELEPRVEKLRNGIHEQDELCAWISQEGKLFEYLKKFLTRLELLPAGSLGPSSVGKIVFQTDIPISASVTKLDIPEDRKTRRRSDAFAQRGRPHCPRKLQSEN